MIVEDQSEVVDFLSSPKAYAGTEPVRRIETHGAMVFLSGKSAIKLKRAVYFDYMDYSTLAKRRAACEAEIRINRRTAPTIYRRTRPIVRRPDGQVTWDGPGKVLDWAICMARFDENRVFDELARRHEVTAEMLDELADEVARFHSSATPKRRFGGRRGIAEVVEENAVELQRYPEFFGRSQVAKFVAVARAGLAAQTSRLERRRRRGLVRHCHGDLHLRNVCLIEGKPTLFDAIEFSESFAYIDVFYDLAFLLMDLWHRGLRAEANRVLNRYMWWRDDFEGLGALPLFLSCRAAIRAHVLAAALAGASSPGDRNDQRAEEARAYLDLATACLDARAPILIAIGGLSGTGKSSIAKRVAPEFGTAPGALLLQSDVVRKRLFGTDPETRLPDCAYSCTAGERTYYTLRNHARRALALSNET